MKHLIRTLLILSTLVNPNLAFTDEDILKEFIQGKSWDWTESNGASVYVQHKENHQLDHHIKAMVVMDSFGKKRINIMGSFFEEYNFCGMDGNIWKEDNVARYNGTAVKVTVFCLNHQEKNLHWIGISPTTQKGMDFVIQQFLKPNTVVNFTFDETLPKSMPINVDFKTNGFKEAYEKLGEDAI